MSVAGANARPVLDVTLVHENGTRIVTQSARVDVATPPGASRSTWPVGAKGQASVPDKGEDIIFTGQSELLPTEQRIRCRPAASGPAGGRDAARAGRSRSEAGICRDSQRKVE